MMFPRIMVPPTTLSFGSDSLLPWATCAHAQMSYDDDDGVIYVEDDIVVGNSYKAAAAMYLGIPLIEVVQTYGSH